MKSIEEQYVYVFLHDLLQTVLLAINCMFQKQLLNLAPTGLWFSS